MKLSVLMPVYNEKRTLNDILDRVLNASLPDGVELEIVAVDDASADGSADIVEKRAEADSRIRVVRHEQNKGKGAAVRTAIEHAQGDIAIIQDADLEYHPEDYPRLLAPILSGEADVVYGSRFASAEYRRVLFYWHERANRMLTMLSNMLTNLNLTDMETCYKVFRMDVLKTMPIRSDRFGIEPEITAKIAKRRLRLFEVPVRYSGRTYLEGKKIGLKDAFQAVWVMLKFHFVDDLYNERYGEQTLRSMELATSFTRWVIDVVRTYLDGTVLEVGAGIGNNVREILDQSHIIATDSDPEYVDLLRVAFEGRSQVQVEYWDATKAPPAGVHDVDTVLCSNVLEHIPEDEAALASMRAVLRPGGRLVLVVPAGANLFGTLDEALDHQRRYDKKSLTAQLEGAGFTVETCTSFNRMGVFGWYLNGKVLKRKALGRYQLKLFDLLVPIFRAIDPILPWTGLSLVAVATKASDAPASSVAPEL